jgi:hypothetical protein
MEFKLLASFLPAFLPATHVWETGINVGAQEG